ncbi:glycosyl hydrolase family 28-related protein [Actinospica robiniae]|uniref:glycosyl hydrolase family 28-related protein n=1 Tax=Actinospica robiniae TaxID=304901 RepID=UPI00040E7A24|nr:glycosyl hydrolase family 28-related protein [Actinospica robiniae]
MTTTTRATPGVAPSRRSLLALGASGLLTGAVVTAEAGSATSAEAAAATTTPAWADVTAYGADRTGAVNASGAFHDAIAALAGTGGVVYIPAGTYNIATTVTCAPTPFMPIYFVGDGAWASILSFTGSGDCLRIYDGTTYAGRARFGGGILGLTIDGSNAATGASSTGVHLGDLLQYELDLTVQAFDQPGSIGIHLDNQYYWTEQLFGRVYAQACASHVVFDWTPGSVTSTSSGSFERCDLDLYINQDGAANDGVVFRNGAFTGNSSLKIRGNFGYGKTAVSSAALRLTGSQATNNYSNASVIADSMLDIGVECAGGTYTPQTVVFGTSANQIQNCHGGLNFGLAGTTFTASNNAGNVANFIGHVNGDATLPEDAWVSYGTGFPTGVTGHVAFRVLPTGSEIMVTWALDIASGTKLTSGESIVAVASRFAYTDNKVIPGNNQGGGLSGNTYAPAFITAKASFQYAGPSYTSSGTSYWYGQGVYTVHTG